MNTKTRYNSKDVLRDIGEKTEMYTIGETKVIYCIDTDEFEISQEHQKQFEEIRKFCEENGYELIWFCHDVEEVFCGKRVSDKQKTKEAVEFRRKKKIEQVDARCLASDNRNHHMSNFLNVFDKYLNRK